MCNLFICINLQKVFTYAVILCPFLTDTLIFFLSLTHIIKIYLPNDILKKGLSARSNVAQRLREAAQHFSSVDMPDVPVVVQPCPNLGKRVFTHISFHAITVGVAQM